ncbi:hypothetical protein [uncultured Algibacter sp.]|uniref:hypothetical protein n=1 Tax=uncultured Algibacter sp. TaxID=298659 RepID=UPI00261D12E7|nr:hypothetical protein [uncultured Algibacter sp.]
MKIRVLTILLLALLSCKKTTKKEAEQIQIVIDSTGLKIEKAEKTTKNSKLISFLENPIDLQDYKAIKGKSLSSVTNGLNYHYHPNIRDSIFYNYSAFPTDSTWSEMEPVWITVFKFGDKRHSWDDKTEILIELSVKGKDKDLKKANIIGLSKAELESEFGTDYLTLDNRIVYSNKNKVLILELENSEVKSFNYIKLSTEKIDADLIRQIIK